jgi:predicted nucleotidyltransferase
MTEDLKKLILKAAEILQSYGAKEVFFFGSLARARSTDAPLLELAVTGLLPDAFFPAMGAMMSVVRRPCRLIDLDEQNPYVAYLRSHGKLHPDCSARVRNELDQLHALLAEYDPLIDKTGVAPPDATGLLALAGVLQLLYAGFDRIFRYIAAVYDRATGKNGMFDADILEWMAMPAPGRTAVISRMLMELLHPYLSFRQYMATASTYRLSWDKMQSLVAEAGEILLLVDAELSTFLSGETAPGTP